MNTKKLVRTALLLSLALVFQIGFRQFAQPLVGPLINMTLILATLMAGPISAIFIGIMTPMIAFMVGIIGLAPIIPVISIGNALLVVGFYFINKLISNKCGNWIGVTFGALIKFGFLTMSVRLILPLFIPKVPPVIITTFSLPQLITALIGGVLALIIYPLLKREI